MVLVEVKYYVVGDARPRYIRGKVKNDWHLGHIWDLLALKDCKANRISGVRSFRLDEAN